MTISRYGAPALISLAVGIKYWKKIEDALI